MAAKHLAVWILEMPKGHRKLGGHLCRWEKCTKPNWPQVVS